MCKYIFDILFIFDILTSAFVSVTYVYLYYINVSCIRLKKNIFFFIKSEDNSSIFIVLLFILIISSINSN